MASCPILRANVHSFYLLPPARGIGCSLHGGNADDFISSRLLLAACATPRPTTADTVPFMVIEWSALRAAELASLAACAAVARLL